MKQVIITVKPTGTIRHPGFGKYGTHVFRKDEHDVVGEPSFWKEPVFTVERLTIDHTWRRNSNFSKRTCVPLSRIISEKIYQQVGRGKNFNALMDTIRTGKVKEAYIPSNLNRIQKKISRLLKKRLRWKS